MMKEEKHLLKKALKKEESTDKVPAGKTKEMSSLASAELVFPFKSIPLVIADIPENYIPLCGPKTQYCYHCQVPPCNLDVAQRLLPVTMFGVII